VALQQQQQSNRGRIAEAAEHINNTTEAAANGTFTSAESSTTYNMVVQQRTVKNPTNKAWFPYPPDTGCYARILTESLVSCIYCFIQLLKYGMIYTFHYYTTY
jgi:hypothetical protein